MDNQINNLSPLTIGFLLRFDGSCTGLEIGNVCELRETNEVKFVVRDKEYYQPMTFTKEALSDKRSVEWIFGYWVDSVLISC